MERQSGWKRKARDEIERIFAFCEGYKRFLDLAKTEREAVRCVETALKEAGFSPDPASGKVYRLNRGKEAIAWRPGTHPASEGVRLIMAHIDAPRLDLKQNPLYEDVDLALLRTHYYGGIKKYHWVAMPLAIHGVIIKEDGTCVEVRIGEDEADPVFAIDDLLPHLSRKHQDEKKVADAIEGEKLTILFGSLPLLGEEQAPVKKHVLKLLKDVYGVTEDDFISAEIEIVPAFKARDVGLDRSMMGAYGQDDRASAYPLLRALCDMEDPTHGVLAIFVDKEEIGSEGNTSAKSRFVEMFLYDVLGASGAAATDGRIHGLDGLDDLVRRALFASKAISADVNGAVNPNWQDVHEKQNACYLGGGVCVTKFTGHGGKVGANDAHAEYVAEIRRLFNKEGIIWQTGELGKIDEGGGGTVAKYLAEYGMDIIDVGVPLLAMHSPFEISNKLDIYETYRAFKAFLAS
ncbi:MAG: Aspartyl aminopeptidase [Deltaproteobacteria bacterium]|jgi:aspartyl aminopeptidase|nr:Aspartyl aminopeptidase [Deltaproteobacteria bacterium]